MLPTRTYDASVVDSVVEDGLIELNADVASATVCNGRAELCSRGYGNTTFLASHDSFAFSSDPFARK